MEGALSLSPWLLLLRVSTVELYGFISAHVLNPIPTSQGRNQPLYERHMTKSSRNRVNECELTRLLEAGWQKYIIVGLLCLDQKVQYENYN